jgi:hypothetical protein
MPPCRLVAWGCAGAVVSKGVDRTGGSFCVGQPVRGVAWLVLRRRRTSILRVTFPPKSGICPSGTRKRGPKPSPAQILLRRSWRWKRGTLVLRLCGMAGRKRRSHRRSVIRSPAPGFDRAPEVPRASVSPVDHGLAVGGGCGAARSWRVGVGHGDSVHRPGLLSDGERGVLHAHQVRVGGCGRN